MINDGILKKLVLALGNLSVLKKVLFVAIILLLILIPSVIFLSKNNSTVVQKSQDKTWEIILSFDAEANKLNLKKISLLDKKIEQDSRSAGFSPYELIVYSENDEAIYKTKINITTGILYSLLYDPPASGSGQETSPLPPSALETVIYVPYLEKGTKAVIKENNESILDIQLQKKNSLNLFNLPQVYAQGTPQSCSPIVVTFVSDGYTDFDRFHQDVDAFIQLYSSIEPYASASIFDFKYVDNAQSLGCKQGSTFNYNCVGYSAITQVSKNAYPETSKTIVLVDIARPTVGVLGAANGIGGDRAVFPSNNGNIDSITRIVAAHEVLGHEVGLLYDRYVSSDLSYGKIQNNIRSNCTDNPSGESFWQGAGGVGVYLGCANKNSYGSSPLACPSSSLINGGTPTTMMSSAGCAQTPIFDSVEQYWIKNQVLPLYCGGTSSGVTTTTVPGGATTTTTVPVALLPLLYGTIYTDSNGNNAFDAGEGFQGAQVTIAGPFNGSANTDSEGKYSFPNIPVGDYTITFTVGSATSNGSFTIKANMSVAYDFIMKAGANTDSTTTTTSGNTTTTIAGGSGGIVCGDGYCDQGETSLKCPADCTPTGWNRATTTTIRYKTANCVFDPNCGSSGDKKGFQVCSLKCTVTSK